MQRLVRPISHKRTLITSNEDNPVPLCSRKQLSDGLFTNYNYSRPDCIAAEDELVALFLHIARTWRKGKSSVAYECFLSAEVDPHLILLAQKLGEAQNPRLQPDEQQLPGLP
ncbi:hypothetical protein BDW72DRAFT_192414 [Aspergillus terricola var. indicus]